MKNKKSLYVDPGKLTSEKDPTRKELNKEELRLAAEYQRASLENVPNIRNKTISKRKPYTIEILVKRGIYSGMVFHSLSDLAKRLVSDLGIQRKVMSVVGELSELNLGRRTIALGLFTREHLEFKSY
jgi:hypothetical protein